MCVSHYMGLQKNRVGRSGFVLQYFFIVLKSEILDKFSLQNLITSLKVVRFTSFCFYMILNKKYLSRTIKVGQRKKGESVG